MTDSFRSPPSALRPPPFALRPPPSVLHLPLSALRPWRTVVTPHGDIRQGKFDTSVFAANLGEVLAGRGAVDYRDALTFFSKTYLTRGLSELLVDVLRRLGGTGKSEPVIQLQTAFGGGKTHTLLALYHLLKRPHEVGKLPEIQQLIANAGAKGIPAANVACVVGTALDAIGERTFWGEMAFQLDGGKEGKLYAMLAENDRRKTSPGTNTRIEFGQNSYEQVLRPTANGSLLIASETTGYRDSRNTYPSGQESILKSRRGETSGMNPGSPGVGHYIYSSVSSWTVYHFHDTSSW